MGQLDSLSPPSGERAGVRGQLTVRLEDKNDGIRCQLHKVGERVALYSRDLKEITATFPEVADAARLVRRDFILDGEILAMRGEEVLPFADLERRLGRREPDLFMREQFPIKYVAFDLLWEDGQTRLKEPWQRRWGLLVGLQPLRDALRLVHVTVATAVAEIDSACAA